MKDHFRSYWDTSYKGGCNSLQLTKHLHIQQRTLLEHPYLLFVLLPFHYYAILLVSFFLIKYGWNCVKFDSTTEELTILLTTENFQRAVCIGKSVCQTSGQFLFFKYLAATRKMLFQRQWVLLLIFPLIFSTNRDIGICLTTLVERFMWLVNFLFGLVLSLIWL